MSTNERAALSPDALLFEIAALCSRHGIPVSSANPGAARHYAERLMHALGLIDESPAASIATSPAFDAPTSRLPTVARRGAHHLSRPFVFIPGGSDGTA